MCRRNFVMLTILSFLLVPAGLAPAKVNIWDVVNQVNEANYSSFHSSLYVHNGDNRGYGPQHDLAQGFIYNTFNSLGLSTSLEAFSYSGQTYYNVVGIKVGSKDPNDIYVVGAHYDSVSTPGADDNGSGVAGVLEAARVLSKYSYDDTLVFIGFDREEQGLVGSSAYVNAHATSNFLGMVSLDMIAYNPASNHNEALIYGRVASDAIKTSLADAITTYSGDITPVIGGDVPQSDHAPFEAHGKQACLLIEYNVWSNPNYHTQKDSLDTAGYIDYAYATEMTRGVVGYLADSAGLLPEPASRPISHRLFRVDAAKTGSLDFENLVNFRNTAL